MAAAFVVGIDLGTTHTVVASAPLGAGGERGGEAGAITLFGIDQWVAPGELGRPALLPSVRECHNVMRDRKQVLKRAS